MKLTIDPWMMGIDEVFDDTVNHDFRSFCTHTDYIAPCYLKSIK